MLGKKKRILVIEDHALAQKIATSILKDLACEVDLAENGTKAFELMYKYNYDLVFVDLGLPDLDGFTIAKKIREEEKFSLIPIIGLSVHATQQTQTQALKSGMNDYITKPLTLENCSTILEKFLSSEAIDAA